MKAYIFPGQGAQFEGMGKDLIEKNEAARLYFDKADGILGFKLSEIMLNGTAEELKQTKVTQPAIFLYSVVQHEISKTTRPDFVAGHSLGEYSALVANKTLSFDDALLLVSKRALAMQKACEAEESTMAAVLGLEEKQIEDICNSTEGIVVPANYNCPGQLVISGSQKAVEEACEKLKEAGARRALILPVGGAFHSPLMEPARAELSEAIAQTNFSEPICPVVQNATASIESDPEKIKQNLVDQLTAPVKWTQSMMALIDNGVEEFIEIGPGKVLTGLMRKIDREATAGKLEI